MLLQLLLQADFFFFFSEDVRKSVTSFLCQTTNNFYEPCSHQKYTEGGCLQEVLPTWFPWKRETCFTNIDLRKLQLRGNPKLLVQAFKLISLKSLGCIESHCMSMK